MTQYRMVIANASKTIERMTRRGWLVIRVRPANGAKHGIFLLDNGNIVPL